MTNDTGLSGGEVARRIRKWIENPISENEPDWDLHTAYCEDDVEALQHIYEHMDNADRILSKTTEREKTEENTVQAGIDTF